MTPPALSAAAGYADDPQGFGLKTRQRTPQRVFELRSGYFLAAW